jgi:hypothetical protein
MNNLTHYLNRIFANRRSLGRSAFIAAAVSLAGSASAQNNIGVNYVNTGNSGVQDGEVDSLGTTEVAGAPAYTQDNWNNLGRWGDLTPLNDDSGAASSVNVAWDANNTWQNGASTNTSDGKLMYGYLDATGGANVDGPPYNGNDNVNKPDAMVTGLSSWLSSVGGVDYSVVVYTDGDKNEGRIGEYWLQSFTGTSLGDLTLGADLTSRVFVSDEANFSGTFTQVPLSADSVANAMSGNFIVFNNLSSDSFLLRTEEWDSPSQQRVQINGFQIVAVVPEPGTLSLLGLGALGLMVFRRRRA